jgi:hypothetical protein
MAANAKNIQNFALVKKSDHLKRSQYEKGLEILKSMLLTEKIEHCIPEKIKTNCYDH